MTEYNMMTKLLNLNFLNENQFCVGVVVKGDAGLGKGFNS